MMLELSLQARKWKVDVASDCNLSVGRGKEMPNLMDGLDASHLGHSTAQPMRLPGNREYKRQTVVSEAFAFM